MKKKDAPRQIEMHLAQAAIGGCLQKKALFNLGELVFANTAKRAYPIVRNIFKSSARSDAAVRITNFGVIYPIANFTNILVLIHSCKF